MTMTLRVVVPPHPLIAHWLTMLRNATTPAPLYATGLEELGRWLSYEAIRDWLPHRDEEVKTPETNTKGTVIEYSVPLLAIPIKQGGFELWQGARKVLPNPFLCIDGVPDSIEANAGVVIFISQIASAKKLLETLKLLKAQNVESRRIRVITAIASSPGLKNLGESIPDLTIYTACIDPELSQNETVIPGIGNPSLRLNTRIASST